MNHDEVMRDILREFPDCEQLVRTVVYSYSEETFTNIETYKILVRGSIVATIKNQLMKYNNETSKNFLIS